MEVMFISVYLSQDVGSKRMLWDRLHQMISSFQGECVLMGDFNVVRVESERLGSQFHPTTSNYFNQFIDQTDLVDIPMGGPRFTWSHSGGSKFSKLDRFLVTDGVISAFPLLSGMVMEKKILDHHRILFLEHKDNYGLYPFCFFPFLVSRFASLGHMESILPVLVIFKKKLQFLKINIKAWNSSNQNQLGLKRIEL
uniref:Endonuclease/exonuclease/phosphatase domain-containing protein n=1 Tax=Lactuca sativa TaxID=4236 RepID=A0A9R1V3W5_LACSA|nr:hypothetical protein LSAT_V11C600306450 [Lactuca sativa]